MSIINDALKKTQNTMNNPSPEEPKKEQPDPKPADTKPTNIYDKMYKPKQTEAAPSSAGSSAKGKNTKQEEIQKGNPGRVWLLLGIMLILGAFVGYKYLGWRPDSVNKMFTPKPRVVKPKPYVPREYDENELFLNGVMVTGDKRVVLINDQIYELGDTVKGRKIMNIDTDTVELLDESGNTTTLSTRRK